MLKTTSIISIICLLAFVIACKNDPPPTSADEQHMISIAGPDYKNDIKLPVDPYGNVDTSSMARISFVEKVFDFDTIDAGKIVNYTYQFTNTGVKDLYITDTQTTCGCTIVSHTKSSVAPGKQGNIEVSYDSKDRNGEQEKVISVYSNTYPNETLLKIKGFVNSPQ